MLSFESGNGWLGGSHTVHLVSFPSSKTRPWNGANVVLVSGVCSTSAIIVVPGARPSLICVYWMLSMKFVMVSVSHLSTYRSPIRVALLLNSTTVKT